MNLRLPKFACWFALLAGATFLPARAADTPAKPAAPDARLSATLTNVSRSTPHKEGLKELEDELSKSLQPFSARGSLDSLMGPQYLVPPMPIAPNRRIITPSKKRGSWSFPDDAGSLEQDPFKTGSASRNKGSLEELSNMLNQPPAGAASASKKGNPSSARSGYQSLDDLDKDNSSLPSGLRDSAKSLREKLLGSDSLFNQGASRGGLSDLLTPDRNGLSREEIDAHKEYMTRYREMLDGPAPKTADAQNPFNSALGANPLQPTPGVVSPNPLAPALRPSTFAATPAGADAVFRPQALPDMNGRVLNSWNPLYAAPAFEPSKTPVPFASPVVEAPRRRF